MNHRWPAFFNGRNNLVKQKHALLRPKGKTAKVKYLSTPLKGQAKPRYFRGSGEISTWWYPDFRSQVKNQCPSWRTFDSERRSSYLNLKRTRWQLTCLRSITKRSFLPSATVKGLTQKGGSLCSVIQPLSKSSEIAWTTKSGCLRADKLLLKKKNTELDNSQKESDSLAKWYPE